MAFETGLRVKIDPSGARQGAQQVNAALSSMDLSARRVVGSMGSAFDSLKRSIFGLQGAFASIGIGLAVRDLVQAQLAFDRLFNTLKAGTGTAQGAAQELDFVRKTAMSLGLSLQDAATEYARLTAASKGTRLEGQATRDIFLAMSKASTVLGLSGEQAGRAFNAFQQIISKGKVSMEEIRGQLGDVLPGAVLIFAEALGVSAAEFQKMVEKGLDASEVLPKVADVLEKRFGGTAADAAKSLNAEINRIKGTVFDLQTEFNRAGFADVMLEVATGLRETIGSEKFKNNVREWARDIKDLFQWLKDNKDWLVPMMSAIAGAATLRRLGTPGAIVGALTGGAVGAMAMDDKVSDLRSRVDRVTTARDLAVRARADLEAGNSIPGREPGTNWLPNPQNVQKLSDEIADLDRQLKELNKELTLTINYNEQVAATGEDWDEMLQSQTGTIKTATVEVEKYTDKQQDLIDKLKVEAAGIGKSNTEREIAKALLSAETDAKSKAGQEIAALITKINKETEALEARNEVMKRFMDELKDEGKELDEANKRTSERAFNYRQYISTKEEEIDVLRKRMQLAGADERSQRIEIAFLQEKQKLLREQKTLSADELNQTKKLIEQRVDLELAEEKTKEAAATYKKIWENAIEDVQKTIANQIERFFEGQITSIEDFATSFLAIIRRLAAQLLTTQIIVPIFYQAANSLGISTPGGSSGGGSIDFGSLLKNGKEVFDLFGNGSSAASTGVGFYGAGGAVDALGSTAALSPAGDYFVATAAADSAGGSLAAGGGAGFGAAGAGLAAGAAGVAIGSVGGGFANSALGGQGGQNSSMIGAIGGAVIGFAVGGPVGALIGGIIGGVAGGSISALIGGTPSVGPNMMNNFVLTGEENWGGATNPENQVRGRFFQAYATTDNMDNQDHESKVQATNFLKIIDRFMEKFSIEIDKSVPDLAQALSFTISNFTNPKEGNKGDREQGFQVEIAGILKAKGLKSISEASAMVIVEIMRKGIELGAIEAEDNVKTALKNTVATTMEALILDLEFASALDTLFDPKRVMGPYETQIQALNDAFEGAKIKAEELGLGVEKLTDSFERATKRVAEQLNKDLDAAINSATGNQHLNDLTTLAGSLFSAFDVAANLGADSSKVMQLFSSQVANIVKGLDSADLDKVIDLFSGDGPLFNPLIVSLAKQAKAGTLVDPVTGQQVGAGGFRSVTSAEIEMLNNRMFQEASETLLEASKGLLQYQHDLRLNEAVSPLGLEQRFQILSQELQNALPKRFTNYPGPGQESYETIAPMTAEEAEKLAGAVNNLLPTAREYLDPTLYAQLFGSTQGALGESAIGTLQGTGGYGTVIDALTTKYGRPPTVQEQIEHASGRTGGNPGAYFGGLGLTYDPFSDISRFGSEEDARVFFRALGVPGMARGGLVRGGTPGADSVPAMLMPGEAVIPASMVAAMSGGGGGSGDNSALEAKVDQLIAQNTALIKILGLTADQIQQLTAIAAEQRDIDADRLRSEQRQQ